MRDNVRNFRLSFALITVGILAAETGLNQWSLSSSFSFVRHGIFQINGTTPFGQAVTASVGQCAGFCSRYYKECQGFLMRDSQCSTCGQDSDGSFANCQLVTAPDGIVIFPGLNSSVNDYQHFYVKASTTVVTECLIETLSWGFIDSTNNGYVGIGYIRLNGNMGILARQTDRGFNIIELDINNCIVTNYHHFDTNVYGYPQYSNELVVYIQSLRPPTVIVGLTVDDAAYSISAAAKNALIGIGVDVSTMSFQGKTSFIAQIGRPSASIVKLAAAGGDNMKMNAAVSTIPGTTNVSIVLLS